MFSTENLYNLLKPKSNPSLITPYEVIIGGTALTANLDNGAIIITPISSIPITSQDKQFKPLILTDDNGRQRGFIKEASIIESTYQIDFYKVNAPNTPYIEAEKEALKIREWLNSFECIEYLEALNSAMLPAYGIISHSAEQLNKKFVNRAFFEFKILTTSEIKEEVGLADHAIIENTLILGNEKE